MPIRARKARLPLQKAILRPAGPQHLSKPDNLKSRHADQNLCSAGTSEVCEAILTSAAGTQLFELAPWSRRARLR